MGAQATKKLLLNSLELTQGQRVEKFLSLLTQDFSPTEMALASSSKT